MRSLRIEVPGSVCDVHIGEALANLPNYVGDRRAIIVTDTNVRKIHGGRFPPWDVIEIGTGERAKNIGTVIRVFERLLELGADRHTLLVGIGGGLVSDVTGFAAATYMRGIDCAFVPTTVLAMADAGVGGKNGVNFYNLKNIIGTFHQPRFVLCDFDFLMTLPARERSSGFAEIVKCGAVGDASLFLHLEEKRDRLLALDRDALEIAVFSALALKVRLVQADQRDITGERALLNFGHTFGHAIEAVHGLSHGEGVSIGMMLACRLSRHHTRLNPGDVQRLGTLLTFFGLPVAHTLDQPRVLAFINHDKKRSGAAIRFILLEQIGKGAVRPIKLRELEELLQAGQ